MDKKIKIKRNAKAMLIFLLIIFLIGCTKKEKDDGTDFVRGSDGLVMSFIPNAPQDKYVVSSTDEDISIAIDVWNKGVHPKPADPLTLDEESLFKALGIISISGFDRNIITGNKYHKKFSESDVYLPAASPLNPRGGLYTAEFDGTIKVNNIVVDKYEPTILVTACYPYFAHAAPSVCIDPQPFDARQEKVCSIGSQNVEPQGAPVAITRIDQEASKGKIRFKITIENLGKGDVIWPNEGSFGTGKLMDRCSPADLSLDPKILDRKDFDKVQLDEVKVGDKNLLDPNKDGDLKDNKCTPFAEGTKNIIRLFDGSGFVICTYDIQTSDQSAYTTPISIKLSYAYRSTISKPISIRKLE